MKYLESIIFKEERLMILDQTLLPEEIKYIEINNLEEACDAIINLKIRGAPAIGVMSALSIYIEMKRLENTIQNISDFKKNLENAIQKIGKTRPTAVNLFVSIGRIKDFFYANPISSKEEGMYHLKRIALEFFEEDKKLCESIGEYGNQLIFDGANILTHCNTGSLATAGIGTALGAIYTAFKKGKKIYVFNTETRPLLQGSRLTSLELNYANIPNTLVTDSMVASLFANKKIDMVMVGADRIAKNGDTANKIGTFSIAIIANYFNIPFYVLAPYTTIDISIEDGSQILIEERKSSEITQIKSCKIAPENINVYNPAFDVTPSRLQLLQIEGYFDIPLIFLIL